MTIAMAWITVGVALLVVAAVWLFGPFGLAGGGAVCVGLGLVLSPTKVDDDGSG